VVFLVAATAAVSIMIVLPDAYQSTVRVLVERHEVPESFVRSLVTGDLETRLQTMSQQILSRARLADLITRLDLYPDIRKRGGAVERIAEKMAHDIQSHCKGSGQSTGRRGTLA